MVSDPEAGPGDEGEAIVNVASSRRFSSHRTIAEYAADIWKTTPCLVE
jgi:hypothetical protein